MAGYTAISDAGRTIVEFLRRSCIPPVEKPEFIGLCSPDETGGFQVGVCLYDISQDAGTAVDRGEIAVDETHVRAAPSAINLHYMIFTALKSDITMRAQDEHRILGCIFQKLNDSRMISDGLYGNLSDAGQAVNITLENISYEDKLRIWAAYNISPKPALFYKVSALLIDSEKVREVKRVTSADITLRQRRKGQ